MYPPECPLCTPDLVRARAYPVGLSEVQNALQ